jgi:hypothetical protein
MRVHDKFTKNKVKIKIVAYPGVSILLLGGARSLLAG